MKIPAINSYDYTDWSERELDEEAVRLDALAKSVNSFADLLDASRPNLLHQGQEMVDELKDGLRDLLDDTLFLALSHVEDAIGDIEAVSDRAHERAHTYR